MRRARRCTSDAQIVSDDRSTTEYLAQFVRSEIEKWAGPIKASGVSIDSVRKVTCAPSCS